ncbi:MAG: nucleoside triphosphate pyrophosphohydrolase [Desulfovibrionaceae bacterium]|nr:nucleoside triphosphate pyrophosphohydrolase [Desulfovibrionaceae bacterium]
MNSDSLHHAIDRLDDILERLTAPDGCPWDSTQTPESLTEYLIEECYELVDAIRSGNDKEMTKELGDVMFLTMFIGKLLQKQYGRGLKEALDSESDKMIRRHPHVFGQVSYEDRESQLKDWERIKREEQSEEDTRPQQPKKVYDSLPSGLPPLTKAYRIHSKADKVGFTWTEDEEVEQQVESEWLELLDAMASGDEKAIEHEFGDHLFSLVELGRRKGIKAAPALDQANRRFLNRFAKMEDLAYAKGLDFPSLSLDEKDELWNEVKQTEKTE